MHSDFQINPHIETRTDDWPVLIKTQIYFRVFLICFYWTEGREMDGPDEVMLIDLRSPDTNMQILIEKLTQPTCHSDRYKRKSFLIVKMKITFVEKEKRKS